MKKILAFALMFAILVGTNLCFSSRTFADNVSASPDSVNYFFQNSGGKLLAVGTLAGRMVNIGFQGVSLSLTKDEIKDEVNKIGRGHSGYNLDKYESFKTYRLIAGSGGDGLNYSLNSHWMPSGKSGTDTSWLNQVGPFILLGAIKNGDKYIYYTLGMYWYQDNTKLGAGFIPNVVLPDDTHAKFIQIYPSDTFEGAVNDGGAKDVMVALNNHIQGNDGFEVAVSNSMAGTNLQSSCVQLDVAWHSLQQMVRDFFIPLPDATHNSINPNWSNDQNTWWERVKSGTSARNVILSIASTYLPEAYAQKAQAMLNDAGSDPFNITSTGAANAQEILSKSEEIKSLIDKIKSSSEPKLEGGTDEWKCGNIAKLTSFKWNKDIKGTEIKDLATLSSAVDKLVSDFNFFKESEDAGTGGICSSGSDTTTYSAIREAMCGLLILMHDWADNIFQTAVDWLNASLGVTNNSTIESPASTSSTSSSSTGSSSSSGSGSSTSGGSGSSTSGGSSSGSTPSSTSGTN